MWRVVALGEKVQGSPYVFEVQLPKLRHAWPFCCLWDHLLAGLKELLQDWLLVCLDERFTPVEWTLIVLLLQEN